tara:strand:+ start:880 stop:1056 length:177 start_codon:yes stop_codon:yes gene_type:complete
MGIENLPVPIKFLMTRNDWERIWREEKIKKDCAERKKNPPKITPLQKKIFNQVVLQDA